MKPNLAFLLLLLVVVFASWSPGGRGADVPPAAPTFHRDLLPILYQHCAPCHRPDGAGPFALLTYAEARKHGREMAEVTARRFMPPWLPAPGHGRFVGERRLSEPEIAVFRDWLAAGLPGGEPGQAPVAPKWPGEWELGPPDLIVRMPAAYSLAAGGRDIYRHFVIPVPPDRRRYVTAWQVRPHSRALHHLFLRLDRTGEARRRDATDADPGFPGMDTPIGINSPEGHFASWQPGAGVRRIAPGLVWALEPETDVVIQTHLQPLGRVEPVQIEIGFYFTDTPPVETPIKIPLTQYGIDVAAGASNVVVGDEVTLPAGARLLGVLPHTHYLGRRIEARAHLPGGGQVPLFLIPEWDFNWQGDYTYQTPILLPAGTRIDFRITFDNSAANPRNPFQPPRRARYGPSTTDEMAELWLQLLPATPADAAPLRKLVFDRVLRDSYAANEQRLRIDPRDAAAMVNQGRVYLARRDYGSAWERFSAAAAADPKADEPRYFLGVLLRIGNQPREAMVEFSRAVTLNPGNARAHGNLGLLHLESNQLESAASHFETALAMDRHDRIALTGLGQVRLRQGRPADAEAVLVRALALEPGDKEARRLLEESRRTPGSRPLLDSK